ncbi:hypothetical protein JVT61DRAFT_3898 [Boletus reticuloceps]|uniref:BTB domain-containing protein n=1 Tax=Boletus reticuloceps TaxID=495285 RepID=A0A8I3A916_9AGAM|nr:hypothetical protein JVT61DRAFT_3898 [Boletus reticuloceps]
MPISLDFSSSLAAVPSNRTPLSQPTTGKHQHFDLSTMSLSVPRERHPEFYFRDWTITFLVPGQTHRTLYWLYPGLLALRSLVLDSVLLLPSQESQRNTVAATIEGSCDENPIILHSIIRREFDYLLTFLFGGYAGEEHRQEFLVSVLKLSAFFEINHGYQYAIAELTCLLPLKSSLKLQLGRLYRVDHWVEPALRDMMARPLLSISCTEAHHMGLDYFYILSHTKAVVEENYQAIAYTEPNLIQPDGCLTQLQCAAVWKDEWWNGVAPQLLHPETPCRRDDLLVLLDQTDIPGLCNLCKEATLRHMKDSDVLKTDMVLQDIAVLEVMEFQTDEHIRRHIGTGLP